MSFEVQPLLDWYHEHQRPMPWRESRDPYRIWASEIMLQQTRVDTVIPYYERFLTRFPNVHALAVSPLDDLLKIWEGLGYYSRARKMHECAKVVVREHNGAFPNTAAGLLELPGIGPYTSSAIASISFGEATPVVDGNVLRVATRYWAMDNDIAKPATRVVIERLLHEPIAGSGDPSSFNQAMMELGATICLPKKPSCLICPLSPTCHALAEALVDQLPVKTKKGPIPDVAVAVAFVQHNGKVLLQKRGSSGMLPGLWEYPGGRVSDANAQDTLVAKITEQLGISVQVGEDVMTTKQTYSHFRVHIVVYACEFAGGELAVADGLESAAWLTWEEVDELSCGLATRKITKILRR